MTYVPPYTFVTLLAADWLGTIDLSRIVEMLTIAGFIAGVFVVAKTSASLKASEAARSALKDEREAAVSARDRIVAELAAAQAKIGVLEARPNLEGIETLLKQMTEIMGKHEENAERRTTEIVSAIGEGVRDRP